MRGGHCAGCGYRDDFCVCWPLLPDSIAILGIFCMLLAFAIIALVHATHVTDPRHGYSRPDILGPAPQDENYEDEQPA